MVYQRRQNKSCSICKQRKVKCDLSQPSCTQCRRAGWTCPGFPLQSQVTFQDETYTVARNAKKPLSSDQERQERQDQGGQRAIISRISPPLHARAIAFFMHKYVFSVSDAIGSYEYLPQLLEHNNAKGVLGTITTAAGLAALANSGNSLTWKTEAYNIYGKAIRELQVELEHPNALKSDQVVGAILLMGTFEVIVSKSFNAIRALKYHTIAAARFISAYELGGIHHDGDITAKLLAQVHGGMIMACHQLQEPIPPIMEKFPYANNSRHYNNAALQSFGNIEEHLSRARAEIKRRNVSSPDTIAAMLLPVDDMLEAWRKSLPEAWYFKSYKNILAATEAKGYTPDHDVYSALHVAVMWNAYRSSRIMVHDAILTSNLHHDSASHIERLQYSIETLKQMSDGICRSARYCLVHSASEGKAGVLTPITWTETPSASGSLLLFWPLYSAGLLWTTPKEQRSWISGVLRYIGKHLGLQIVISMALKLEGLDPLRNDVS